MRTTERIQRLLDPAYTQGLADHDATALRAMRDECAGVETSLSYYRRLAQARLEILEAERARRAEGGSVEDLIARLPDILGGEQGRASGANTRIASDTIVELDLGADAALVADDTLANLPLLDDAQLRASIDGLLAFERTLSDRRASLHSVIDAIEHEIAARAAADVG